MNKTNLYSDASYIRKLEKGERHTVREKLIPYLTEGLKVTSVEEVNRTLELAGFEPLTLEEIDQCPIPLQSEVLASTGVKSYSVKLILLALAAIIVPFAACFMSGSLSFDLNASENSVVESEQITKMPSFIRVTQNPNHWYFAYSIGVLDKHEGGIVYFDGSINLDEYYVYFDWDEDGNYENNYLGNTIISGGIFDFEESRWGFEIDASWKNENPNWNNPDLWRLDFYYPE